MPDAIAAVRRATLTDVRLIEFSAGADAASGSPATDGAAASEAAQSRT